jgi:peptidyl-tRNA hydrolase
MASMNPGKACAQASHASDKFAHNTRLTSHGQKKIYEEWREQSGQGFGTVIVKAVNLDTLIAVIAVCKEQGYEADTVIDPTYPLLDGDYTHIIPNVVTGGYVFVGEHELDRMPGTLKELDLMK